MSSSKKLTKPLQNYKSFNHLKQIQSFVITYGLSQVTTIYLWNSIFKVFSISAQPLLSIFSYTRMRQNRIHPDRHTFPLLLKSFSKSKNENPFQIYAHIVKYGMETDNFVRNSLITAFANCGYADFARQVFDESSEKDAVTWTAMIDGYVKNGSPAEALKCFKQMRSIDVKIDEVTVVSGLSAAGTAGNIWFGKWVHGFYVLSGRVNWDVYVGSALVDMYSKCGYCDDARRVFEEMPMRNVVSWSALIAGYVQCNRFKDALLLFQSMLLANFRPSQSTLTSVLTASAQLGALDQGRWAHQYIDRNSLEINTILGTALIDMYAKCGCVIEAFQVFDKLPVKNVYPWTAMINGLAIHGDAISSLKLFHRMLNYGVQPNSVTFLGVLSACAHGGLVNEGQRLFELMRKKYHLEPNVDHYGCMVDLLGRAGCLDEARMMIEDMPMEPTPGVWGALFGACMIHKAFDLGEYVGNLLIKLQPNHSGRYACLANMYSAYSKWDKAAYVRKIMKEKSILKRPGYSWIEVNGLIHEFITFDGSHSESTNIYEMLDNISSELKLIHHFQPDTMLLSSDI